MLLPGQHRDPPARAADAFGLGQHPPAVRPELADPARHRLDQLHQQFGVVLFLLHLAHDRPPRGARHRPFGFDPRRPVAGPAGRPPSDGTRDRRRSRPLRRGRWSALRRGSAPGRIRGAGGCPAASDGPWRRGRPPSPPSAALRRARSGSRRRAASRAVLRRRRDRGPRPARRSRGSSPASLGASSSQETSSSSSRSSSRRVRRRPLRSRLAITRRATPWSQSRASGPVRHLAEPPPGDQEGLGDDVGGVLGSPSRRSA